MKMIELDDDEIVITKEKYKKLLDDRAFLQKLKAYGVDNWEGYSDACKEFYKEGDEN